MRFSGAEQAEITAAARARTVTNARFLATAGLATARGETRVPNEERDAHVDELAALRAQLARVGNNINQLARLANTGAVPHSGELARALFRLRGVITTIDRTADALVSGRPT